MSHMQHSRRPVGATGEPFRAVAVDVCSDTWTCGESGDEVSPLEDSSPAGEIPWEDARLGGAGWGWAMRAAHSNTNATNLEPAAADPAREVDGSILFELLDLEELDRDLYRATTFLDEPSSLYGGQVAAQALMAAGRTVPDGRIPHSLHGYYLRGGDAARPTIFKVDRDRDGRSFSARRVVAVQGGKVIFNMSASFQRPEDGADVQVDPMSDAGDPTELPEYRHARLFSMEARLCPQPYPDAGWPTRFWSRCTTALPDDPLAHAVVLTYLSDASTGLSALHDENFMSGSSLDHAVWFHRPIRLDDWVLVDLVPRTVASGRGWYAGTVTSRAGVLGASLTQEALFRPLRRDRATARVASDV